MNLIAGIAGAAGALNPLKLFGDALGSLGQGVESLVNSLKGIFGGDKGAQQVQSSMAGLNDNDPATGDALVGSVSDNFTGGDDPANAPITDSLKAIQDAKDRGLSPDYRSLYDAVNQVASAAAGGARGMPGVNGYTASSTGMGSKIAF